MLTVVGCYSGIVLEKVAEYFYYNYVNRDRDGVKDMEIPPELCLELLMAADYLDSKLSGPSLISSQLTWFCSLNQPFLLMTSCNDIRWAADWSIWDEGWRSTGCLDA